jgi:hypothetical protein
VKDQLWLHTFSEYTRRFEDAICSLPSDARRPGSAFDPKRLMPGQRAEVENSLRKYFNLCSEEHYLFMRGRIDKRTWNIWTTGIEDMFRLPWFADVWEDMRPEYSFYVEFCDFLDLCQRQARMKESEARFLSAVEEGAQGNHYRRRLLHGRLARRRARASS